jgi:hypothetical protein
MKGMRLPTDSAEAGWLRAIREHCEYEKIQIGLA